MMIAEQLLALIAAASVALAANAAAYPRPRVLAVQINCPTTGGGTACLRVRIFRHGSQTAADSRSRSWDMMRRVILKGSLSAGEPQTFLLKIENPAYSWQGASDLGPVAYLGRSKANRPIIQTDAGPFEILSPRFDVNADTVAVLVDEPHWKVVASYFQADSIAWVVTAPNVVAVFDFVTGSCVSAPQMAPGPLKILPRACDTIAATDSGLIPEGSIFGDFNEPPIAGIWADPNRYDPLTDMDRHMELKIGDPDNPKTLDEIHRIRGGNYFIAKTAWSGDED